jgi:hypothetical protein
LHLHRSKGDVMQVLVLLVVVVVIGVLAIAGFVASTRL